MTAQAPAAPMTPAGRTRLARGPEVLALWRRLTWVTWRQHRTSLLVTIGLFALPAAVMAVTGLNRRWHAGALAAVLGGPHQLPDVFAVTVVYVELLPIVVALILGAPLLASEAESGLLQFAWTQGVGKGTLLIMKVATMVTGLLVAAVGLSAELTWWGTPDRGHLHWPNWYGAEWTGGLFGLRALPYAGWTVFAFCAGVALGVLTRRTVPALVATVVGCVTVFYLDNWHWRAFYLPPLHSVVPFRMNVNAAYYYEIGERSDFTMFAHRRPSRFVVSIEALRRNGHPLVHGDLSRPPNWVAHHIVLSMTYQPWSRLVPFQYLEFGYLIVLSVLLIAAAVVLIRRRSA